MTDTVLAGSDRGAPPHPPSPPAPGGRAVRRRQSLPGGRAVVGGFLVALAALGIFVAWARVTAQPSTRYVVARHELRVGAQVRPADVVLLPMELPRAVLDRNVVFTDTARVIGATVLSPIRPGELVQASDLVRKASDEGDVEVSFAIDPARAVGGDLAPGERVDVVLTVGTGADAYTVTVVRDARVLRADRRSGSLGDRSTVVILAVPTRDDAVAVAHAATSGDVTLVRTTGARPAATPAAYRAPTGDEAGGGRTGRDGPRPGARAEP